MTSVQCTSFRDKFIVVLSASNVRPIAVFCSVFGGMSECSTMPVVILHAFKECLICKLKMFHRRGVDVAITQSSLVGT